MKGYQKLWTRAAMQVDLLTDKYSKPCFTCHLSSSIEIVDIYGKYTMCLDCAVKHAKEMSTPTELVPYKRTPKKLPTLNECLRDMNKGEINELAERIYSRTHGRANSR